jgi:hypothetical protein
MNYPIREKLRLARRDRVGIHRAERALDKMQFVTLRFGSFTLPSKIAWIPSKRHCNQAVIRMCNSMHLVDKNLCKVPYFRRIEEY